MDYDDPNITDLSGTRGKLPPSIQFLLHSPHDSATGSPHALTGEREPGKRKEGKPQVYDVFRICGPPS